MAKAMKKHVYLPGPVYAVYLEQSELMGIPVGRLLVQALCDQMPYVAERSRKLRLSMSGGRVAVDEDARRQDETRPQWRARLRLQRKAG